MTGDIGFNVDGGSIKPVQQVAVIGEMQRQVPVANHLVRGDGDDVGGEIDGLCTDNERHAGLTVGLVNERLGQFTDIGTIWRGASSKHDVQRIAEAAITTTMQAHADTFAPLLGIARRIEKCLAVL